MCIVLLTQHVSVLAISIVHVLCLDHGFCCVNLQPFPAKPLCLLSMARAKNEASAKEVAKTLRGCMPSGLSRSKLTEVDIEQFIDHHKEVLVDLLKVTMRPTKKVLQKAAAMAWDVCSAAEAEMFASRLVAAFSYCRAKDAQSTSCKKLSPSVAAVVKMRRQLSGLPSPEAPPTITREEGHQPLTTL